MKKTLVFIIILIIFCSNSAFAKKKNKEVLKNLPESSAPAIEFDLDDYKDYFKKYMSYKINLKSRSKYVISCQNDIVGVTFGDVENVEMSDVIDNGEYDPKSVILKTRFETYTYVRLYKNNGEIVDITLNVNPVFDEYPNTSFDTCIIKAYRG